MLDLGEGMFRCCDVMTFVGRSWVFEFMDSWERIDCDVLVYYVKRAQNCLVKMQEFHWFGPENYFLHSVSFILFPAHLAATEV